jgi:hypothetical protein
MRILRLAHPLLLVAPGLALIVIFYSLDYPYPDAGAFPAHAWSAAGAVAGWLLLLASLVLISASPFTTWTALFSAIAVGAVGVDRDGQVSRDVSTWLGVVGSSVIFVVVAARTLINVFGPRRARVYSLAACAMGIGAFGLGSLYPQSPIWNGPPAGLLAALLITPAFVVLRRPYFWVKPTPVQVPDQPQTAPATKPVPSDSSLFHQGVFGEQAQIPPPSAEMRPRDQLTPEDEVRFGPPTTTTWLAGCPWWGWVYFLVFVWSVNDVAQPLRRTGANNVVAYGGAILALALVAAFIAIAGPRIYLSLKPWLDPTIGDWQRLDNQALALHNGAKTDAPTDEDLMQAEALYRQALQVADAAERPLLIATASNNLASVLAQQDRMPEAIRLFERALQLRKAYAGENSEATTNSIQRLEAAHHVGRQEIVG